MMNCVNTHLIIKPAARNRNGGLSDIYVTGIMCAVVDKKLSSRVGFKGIFKKVLIFALVGLGHILDTYVIGTGAVLRTAIIFFYISNEGVSLIENAAYLGLPVPKKLKAVLEQLHNRAEKEKDTETNDETETEDDKDAEDE